MNEVTIQTQSALQAVSHETQAIMQMIERVVLNPEADMDKLDKMLDMQERILNRNAKQAFTADLAAMQSELPLVGKAGEGHNKAKYAKLEDINEAIRPTLQKYGFAVTFRVKQTDKLLTVIAILSHRLGHSEDTDLMLPLDASGSKNAVQAVGSTISYGKRYALCALLNISTGDDTDGNLPPQNTQPQQKLQDRPKTPISDSKFAEVVARIKSGEVNILRLINNHELTAPQRTIFQSEFPQVQL